MIRISAPAVPRTAFVMATVATVLAAGSATAQDAPATRAAAPAQAAPTQAPPVQTPPVQAPPTDTDPRIIPRGRQIRPVAVEGPGQVPPTAQQGPRAPRAELQGADIPAAGEITQAPEAESAPRLPSTIAPLTRPGGPPLAEATPAVHARIAFMTERCRSAGGGQGDGARAVNGADLNGDGITDWLLEEGLFHCPGAPNLFRDNRAGSTMSVYVGGAADPSRASFSHGVYNAAMIEDHGAWTLWGVVGGPMCGQQITPQTPLAEIRRCVRPVGVAVRASAADFAPIVRAMSETDWNRYVGSRLVGRWTQAEFPTCENPEALRFNPDGTLNVAGRGGRWAIDNGHLAISIQTPEGIRRYSAKLSRIGVATVDVQWNTQLNDGEASMLAESPLIRCPAPGAVPPPPAPTETAPAETAPAQAAPTAAAPTEAPAADETAAPPETAPARNEGEAAAAEPAAAPPEDEAADEGPDA